jgi:diguanylate cyclase (GGDEF)-like protein
VDSLRDRARHGEIAEGTSLPTRPVRTMLLLAAAAVLVVVAAATSSGSPLLLALAAISVVLVLYRTATLTSDLHRQQTLSVQLDEALAQVIQHRDELEAQRHELQRLALYDVVTGLGNRVLLRNRGTDLGAQLDDTTLLLLDLDGFKEVNDTLGHALGDGLLRQVGDRLMTCVREQDTVVRLGGDEFAVLLPDMGAWAAARTADRLLDVLRRPFVVDRQEVQVRGSVGIAEGRGAQDLDELLRNADLAMYQAKAAGRDRYCEFRADMVVDTAERFSLDAEMRQALAAGDFKVYYQPIVDSRSHELRSLEALVRWEHPVRGVLPPSDFLAIAYRTGLIVELGQFMLRSACEQTAVWRRKRPGLTVAVNVSHRELLHPDFSSQVAGVLAMTDLPPEALYLEVTETVLAAEEQITDILQPLTDMGVRCSLDDFGTGHSSLSRLRQLKLDRVKIDRSFVSEIAEDDSEGAPLLVSIVGLAHSIGLSVVAEGVETKQQAEFLAAHGCDELQGYYFSRPISSADLQSRFLSSTTVGPTDPQAADPLLRPATTMG